MGAECFLHSYSPLAVQTIACESTTNCGCVGCTNIIWVAATALPDLVALRRSNDALLLSAIFSVGHP